MLGLARKSTPNVPARGGGQLSRVQREFLDLVYDSGMSKSKHRNIDKIRLALETAEPDVRPVLVNAQEVSQEFRPYNVHAMGKWEGYTPLHVATHYGYEDVCRLFLLHRADPNIVEEDRHYSPLHTAVSRNLQSAEVLVQLLLQEGADPNLPDKEGNTPLHIAIAEVREFERVAKPGAKMNFNPEVVIENLLQAGADPLRTNNNGETPFYLAQAPGGGIQIPFLKTQHEKLLKQQLHVELLAQPLFGPSVDISSHDLDDNDGYLLEWCTVEQSMVNVNFSYNRLSAKVLSPKLLQQLRHITTLNLEHNNIGDEGVSILLPCLGEVIHLNLGSNCISKEGIELIAEFASQASRLKELVLSGNPSPGDSLHSLGRALVQNRNLRWLALARCGIGESDALLCICQIIGPRDLPFGIDFRCNEIKNTAKMLRHLEHHQLPALICVDGQVAHTEQLSFLDSPLIRSMKHLVLEGGGVKGIAYLGALRTLEAHGIHYRDMDGVAGTSVGAITATLLTVGYSGQALTDVLENLPIDSFLDFDEQLHGNKKFALDEVKKDIKELLQGFNGGLSLASILINAKEALSRIKQLVEYLDAHDGLCQGDAIRNWIETKIREKVGIDHLTFYELHHLQVESRQKPQQLAMVGLNLSTGQTEIFSYQTTPFVVISDAVRISLSIPFIFKPHQKYVKYPQPSGGFSGTQTTPPRGTTPPPTRQTVERSFLTFPPAPLSDPSLTMARQEIPEALCKARNSIDSAITNPSDNPMAMMMAADQPPCHDSQSVTIFRPVSAPASHHSLSPCAKSVPCTPSMHSPLRRPPPTPVHPPHTPETLIGNPQFPPIQITHDYPVSLTSDCQLPRTVSELGPRSSKEQWPGVPVAGSVEGPVTHIVRPPTFNRTAKLLSSQVPPRTPLTPLSVKDRFRTHGRHQDLSLHRYVDGAVTCNYPLCIVPPHAALGMRLISGAQYAMLKKTRPPPAKATKGLRNYGTALMQGFLLGSFFVEEQRDDSARTIYINAGEVRGVDFQLDKAQQQELLQAGRDAVISYLSHTMRQYLLQLTSFHGTTCVPQSLKPKRLPPPS